MAKPFGDLAGNGMHVHCSLVDNDGNNVFDDGSWQRVRPLLRQAIAGCLDMMADSMLLFAPNLNSYRRFRRGTHAPMAPTWGYENRTVVGACSCRCTSSHSSRTPGRRSGCQSVPGHGRDSRRHAARDREASWRPPHLSRGMPTSRCPQTCLATGQTRCSVLSNQNMLPIIWGPNSKRCLQFSSNRKWTLLTVK